MTPDTTDPNHMLRNLIVAVALVSGLLVIGVGGWAVMTEYSGAVIAPAQVVIDGDLKRIQHPTGGVVAELAVRDGQRVEAGDLLVRLDDTLARTDLAIVSKALDELAARQARLEAEHAGLASILFPADLLRRTDETNVALAVTGERQRFVSRNQTNKGQKEQLMKRVLQLKEEISGYEAQFASKGEQMEWVTKELVGINELWQKHLVAYSRVTNLEREKARLAGERGQLTALMAQTRGKALELEVEFRQIDFDLRAEVNRELSEIRASKTELTEREIAARDQLQRIDMRAQLSGVIHELDVHTIGGVIAPGEPVMLIVPDGAALIVQARVQPQDIDQIVVDQSTIVRLTAYSQQTTPELNGTVSLISADVSQDEKSGEHYYTVQIAVPENEVARLAGLLVVPGMPADVFIQTNSRTVISFLTRPLRDQVMRAFREQ